MDDCIGQYGAGQISEIIVALLEYGEVRARAVISALPDGRFTLPGLIISEGDLLKTNHVRLCSGAGESQAQ